MNIWQWWWNLWKPPPVPGSGPTQVPNSLITDVFNELNLLRNKNGLSPFKNDEGMRVKAQSHSVDMAKALQLSHTGFPDRVESVHPNTRAAEDVEYNSRTTAVLIVQQWAQSAPHLRNILGDYNLIGLGAATGSDNNDYWTAVFDYF